MGQFHPNSKSHKSKHCGYKGKPTKSAVNALLSLYAGINSACGGETTMLHTKSCGRAENGKQLRLDL
jgi:hypothetical protein